MQSEPENTIKENEKKPYQTPRLIKHGTVEKITGQLDCDDNGISGCVDRPD